MSKNVPTKGGDTLPSGPPRRGRQIDIPPPQKDASNKAIGGSASPPFNSTLLKEVARGLRKAAVASSRMFTEFIGVLERRRGKGGQQKVILAHDASVSAGIPLLRIRFAEGVALQRTGDG